MPRSRTTFQLSLPLTAAQRQKVIIHLLDQRMSSTEDDISCNGTAAELRNIHLHGREGLEHLSDAALLVYAAGEEVRDLGFIPAGDEWVQAFGFPWERVVRDIEELFWLYAKCSTAPIRYHDKPSNAWATMRLSDLFSHPRARIEEILRTGIAHLEGS